MQTDLRAASGPLLSLQGLTKVYGKPSFFGGKSSNQVTAVDGVSFDIQPGEVFGLVGESGSGKSTVGKLALRLEDPTQGIIRFDGQDISRLKEAELKSVRARMQVVFQDPYAAINPRMSVGQFVGEPLVVHGRAKSRDEYRAAVETAFRQVGLDPRFMDRYPHEFSGGQRQRVNIARAIILRPKLIVADEAITALDVSIQAQIINLFKDLNQELGISYLFVAHDLSMVRFLCRRLAVMLRGRIVEMGDTEAIFSDPRHPYTQSLLSAVPIPDPDIERSRKRIEFEFSGHRGTSGVLNEVSPDHFVAEF